MRCWKQFGDVDDCMGVSPPLKSPMWYLAEGLRQRLSRHFERLCWQVVHQCVWVSGDLDCHLFAHTLTLTLQDSIGTSLSFMALMPKPEMR